MGRKNASRAFELFYATGVLAAAALIVVMSRPNRQALQQQPDGREVIRVEPRLPQTPRPLVDDPAGTMRDEVRRSEDGVRKAKEELEALKAEIEKKTAEMRKLSAESEAAAARNKQETEESIRELSAQRDKLEAAASEAEDKARAAREEMAEANESLEKQRELAAHQGISRSLGRGRIVDMQTRLDPRTKRDPRMLRTVPEGPQVGLESGQPPGVPITSLPAGEGEFSDGRRAINFEIARSMSLDNRLKATETFFEARRINRAARALEAGPRVTLEEAVRTARLHAPRRLTDLELDPLTGEITWPLALTDDMYVSEKAIVQKKFHDRATGISVDMQRFNAVNEAISKLRILLKDNIDRYMGSHYGKARSFLDSLLYEFELPPT